MKILAIDTSCDETAAAVTEGLNVLSNIVWSQASAHAKFGGVMPSLAKRMHEERIDWVVEKALTASRQSLSNDIDAIAVTVGPGLSIALGVGIDKAKELSIKYKKPIIGINHIEGHLLSSFANSNMDPKKLRYPVLGLVVSGGNTLLLKINQIGSYETLAETTDDALGEALDKAARMLGLGYPGGPVLEKMAKHGDKKKYKLPVPIVGQEKRQIFTYSGLKTAMMREIGKAKRSDGTLSRQSICDLSYTFQDVAFKHIERVLDFILNKYSFSHSNMLVGGGVSANVEIRKRLRKLAYKHSVNICFPKTKKLYGDNAAMIGVAANFKAIEGNFDNVSTIDRKPGAKLSD